MAEPPSKRARLDATALPNGLAAKAFARDDIVPANSRTAAARAWAARQALDSPEAVVHGAPFPSLVLPDLFADDVLAAARQQVLGLDFQPRANDLYHFEGSGDLADANVCPSGSPLAQIRDALYSARFVELVSEITGVELTPGARPDISAHIYRRGDFLACHDDDIKGAADGRRIAFILYLVPADWTAADDGGALNLFDLDADGQPDRIAHSIAPRSNSLALFEVTPTSYHEVADVTSTGDDRFRLSISGWFRGPLRSRLALRRDAAGPTSCPTLHQSVSAVYLDPARQAQISEVFAEQSSIELRDFFTVEAYASLAAAFAKPDAWSDRPTGPASVRRYHTASVAGADSPLVSLLRSTEFCALLGQLTGLDPPARAHRVTPRLFAASCYTLLHDHARDPEGLDVIVGLGDGGDGDWDEAHGGALTYVAGSEDGEDDGDGDDAELLSSWPASNALTLVLRDRSCLRYVRRVSCDLRGLVDANGRPRGRVDVEALYAVTI